MIDISWQVYLGMWFSVCVSVCVLTATKGGNLQLSVREVGGTIRSLCNWEHERKCEKGWRARRTLLDTFERICVCVRLGGSSMCHSFTHSWLLSSTLLTFSQLLVLALTVSGEFRWTMKTISAVPLPLPSPFPSHPLPEKQDVMDSTSERSKGTRRLLRLTKNHFPQQNCLYTNHESL